MNEGVGELWRSFTDSFYIARHSFPYSPSSHFTSLSSLLIVLSPSSLTFSRFQQTDVPLCLPCFNTTPHTFATASPLLNLTPICRHLHSNIMALEPLEECLFDSKLALIQHCKTLPIRIVMRLGKKLPEITKSLWSIAALETTSQSLTVCAQQWLENAAMSPSFIEANSEKTKEQSGNSKSNIRNTTTKRHSTWELIHLFVNSNERSSTWSIPWMLPMHQIERYRPHFRTSTTTISQLAETHRTWKPKQNATERTAVHLFMSF